VVTIETRDGSQRIDLLLDLPPRPNERFNAMPKPLRFAINSAIGQRLKVPMQRVLANNGLAIVPSRGDDSQHLMTAIQSHNIRTVLDVGGNAGQFGTRLRLLGYEGRILSIEPMTAAFARLEQNAKDDADWLTYQVAVSDRAAEMPLNIAGNSTSSSLLPITERHIEAASTSRTVRIETVRTMRLDDLLEEVNCDGPYFLKVDVQGSELAVLDGATKTLGVTPLIQVEVSFRRLYDGAPDYLTVLARLDAEGFFPVGIAPAFSDPTTGDLLQADVLAVASTAMNSR
jgi:FkbM family methyltransferase